LPCPAACRGRVPSFPYGFWLAGTLAVSAANGVMNMNKLLAIIGLVVGFCLVPAGVGIPMVLISLRELSK